MNNLVSKKSSVKSKYDIKINSLFLSTTFLGYFDKHFKIINNSLNCKIVFVN